ncbi:MAG: single-stranded DNA-binding protein [Cyclobacteriaceae bacterium]|nr:single-stranded DNA-binding protein [Cyclobacteriaceae bacterium]
MRSALSKTTIIGRIGQAPETKKLESGQSVTKFSVATNSFMNGKDGSKQITDWHNVTLWGNEALVPHLKKGQLVYVQGRNKYGTYERNIGNEKVEWPTVEIVASEVEILHTPEAVKEAQSA